MKYNSDIISIVRQKGTLKHCYDNPITKGFIEVWIFKGEKYILTFGSYEDE